MLQLFVLSCAAKRTRVNTIHIGPWSACLDGFLSIVGVAASVPHLIIFASELNLRGDQVVIVTAIANKREGSFVWMEYSIDDAASCAAMFSRPADR